jgi:hypothetical protein
MKIQINTDDVNYLANLGKFKEELSDFLSKWGYIHPKIENNAYFSTIYIKYDIDRINLEKEQTLEEFMENE